MNTLLKWKNSKLSKPLFSSIRPIDRTPSGATTPGQSRLGSVGNEGVFRIPQSSNITRTSPSYCLVSYQGQSLGRGLTLCRDAVGVFYNPCRLGDIQRLKSSTCSHGRRIIGFVLYLKVLTLWEIQASSLLG